MKKGIVLFICMFNKFLRVIKNSFSIKLVQKKGTLIFPPSHLLNYKAAHQQTTNTLTATKLFDIPAEISIIQVNFRNIAFI
jgi:hypothetical protein